MKHNSMYERAIQKQPYLRIIGEEYSKPTYYNGEKIGNTIFFDEEARARLKFEEFNYQLRKYGK